MIHPNSRIHINYSTEKASDGTVIRSSIMVNIHEDDVQTAVKLYNDLKSQLEGIPASTSAKNEIKVEPFVECPVHHVKMLFRTRRSTGEGFLGCPFWSSKGCQKTHTVAH